VNAATPEIAMAVRADYQGRGFGRKLLDALIEMAREDGFPALSLSASPLNSARQLYESTGFRKVGESGTSWTLLLFIEARFRGVFAGFGIGVRHPPLNPLQGGEHCVSLFDIFCWTS